MQVGSYVRSWIYVEAGANGFANRLGVRHKRKRSITDGDCIWPELMEGWNFTD